VVYVCVKMCMCVCAQAFTRSIAVAPEASAGKWLYIGQLSEGRNAALAFQKGISLLMAERERGEVCVCAGV
jgi:hypothetical protein